MESHTRPRGPSESPDGVDPNIGRTRKTQRDGHNSGVKIWSLCSVPSTLSHANLWTTLLNTCNKVRGEYFSKEVFLRFPSCVCLWYCVVVMLNDDVDDYLTYVYVNARISACISACMYSSMRTCVYVCMYVLDLIDLIS